MRRSAIDLERALGGAPLTSPGCTPGDEQAFEDRISEIGQCIGRSLTNEERGELVRRVKIADARVTFRESIFQDYSSRGWDKLQSLVAKRPILRKLQSCPFPGVDRADVDAAMRVLDGLAAASRPEPMGTELKAVRDELVVWLFDWWKRVTGKDPKVYSGSTRFIRTVRLVLNDEFIDHKTVERIIEGRIAKAYGPTDGVLG